VGRASLAGGSIADISAPLGNIQQKFADSDRRNHIHKVRVGVECGVILEPLPTTLTHQLLFAYPKLPQRHFK
jgi:hypothetical protein